MKHAVTFLERYFKEHGKELCGLNALEMFARDGAWATVEIARKVGRIEAWEIDGNFIPALTANLPDTADIRCGDSIRFVLEQGERPERTFDIISVDNPNGLYGEDQFEHFRFMHKVPGLLAPAPSAMVFYVNLSPYDPRVSRPLDVFDDYGMRDAAVDRWFEERERFYGRPASALSEDFVIGFYLDFLEKGGMRRPEFLGFSKSNDFDGHICFGSR